MRRREVDRCIFRPGLHFVAWERLPLSGWLARSEGWARARAAAASNAWLLHAFACHRCVRHGAAARPALLCFLCLPCGFRRM